ncbi:MAG: VOC family protein [Nitrospiria bacterium]
MRKHKVTLSSLHLFVKDMSASVTFYRRVGLSIPDDAVWSIRGKGHHAEIPMTDGLILELDSIELTKSYNEGWQAPTGPSRNLIMFSLPSGSEVDELYGNLTTAGYSGHLAPMDAFWGARYAVVYDPDGNQIGLMGPRDSNHQRSPLENLTDSELEKH